MNHTKLNIIYEDNNVLVANKEGNQELHIKDMIPLNNLSKEASGIVIFLKNSDFLNNINIKYSYIVIVEGYIETNSKINFLPINRKENYSIVKFNSFISDMDLRKYLMNINHPIIGDYNFKSTMNPIRRICLHLYKVEITGKSIKQEIYSNIPDSFKIFFV